jgi:hypothetical protein
MTAIMRQIDRGPIAYRKGITEGWVGYILGWYKEDRSLFNHGR